MWKPIVTALPSLLPILLAGCCNPGAATSLDVVRHPQETSNWCWAASGQMIMHWLGHDVSQCKEANALFGRTDCCSIALCPSPALPQYGESGCVGCTCPGWPQFDKFGFSFQRTTNAALSWSDLRKQIADDTSCKKRPFAFTWRWEGGGGHMMVVKGYRTVNGENFVVVLDPWAPCAGQEEVITYDEYVASPDEYTHWDDFYDITYEGGAQP